MSRNTEKEVNIMEELSKELKELYSFRDLFFENHPIEMAGEKNKLIEEKKHILVKKIEAIDEMQIPVSDRAQFLYMKGRCYNISTTYDPRAIQCLSKAVKLCPTLIDAWNELGECYWKNMNVKDAKASFEGALKYERNPLTLRCLSIILRQESTTQKHSDAVATVMKSVDLAKEAVTQNIKDGLSWTVLGNTYLCQFFLIAQDPNTLKLCMSAYKQACTDPIAKGQPDLYYNRGIALKYDECYSEAIQDFDYACQLEPPWEPPRQELTKLVNYLTGINQLVNTRGKIKIKKLQQMVQSIDKKMLGVYSSGVYHTIGDKRQVKLEHVKMDSLKEGVNEGKVILGKVVGSMHNDGTVPFTLAIVDESMCCLCLTVYNWAEGRGAIIGDCIAIPEPSVRLHKYVSNITSYDFKSIRINNPMVLLINSKRVSRNEYARPKIISTYQIH